MIPTQKMSNVESSGLDYIEDDIEVDEGTAVAPQRRPTVKSGPPPQRKSGRTSPSKPMYEFGTDDEDLA